MHITVMQSGTQSYKCQASAEVVCEMISNGDTVCVDVATASELNSVLPVWKGQYRRPVATSAGVLFGQGV